MTSRERVRKVLNHEIPDRVPNGLGGCETAGLHVLTYSKLQEVLGVSPTPPRLDTFMSNAVFELDVMKAMQGDVLLLASPNMCKASLRGDDSVNQWKEQTLWKKTFRVPKKDIFSTRTDGSIVWETCGNTVCPPGSFFFDSGESTDMLSDLEYPDPDTYHPPMELNPDLLRNLEETAKKMYHETDLCISLGESITDLQIAPAGFVGSMILMLERPDIMQAYLEKSLQAALAQLKQLDQAVGKYVDLLAIAHDFGDNRGVTIGAELFRELYKPFYERLFKGWKQTTSMKINLHSCGSISEILGDFIECGVDVYNPVQISANDMEANSLKQRFGNDLVFYGGGYDAQQINLHDDEETVYRKVCHTIKIFKDGGGYLFSGVHNLPAEIPHHHLKAMLQAYYDTASYESTPINW